YTGRLAGDASGTMSQGEATVITGAGSQTGGLSRWGDYTEMTVDPADDCTFWYVNQYEPANGPLNWHTRIASFKVPTCGGGGGNIRRRAGCDAGAVSWTQRAGVIGENGPAEPAHTGTGDGWLDGYGTSHTERLWQQVAMQTTAAGTLTFWLHIDTAETTTT